MKRRANPSPVKPWLAEQNIKYLIWAIAALMLLSIGLLYFTYDKVNLVHSEQVVIPDTPTPYPTYTAYPTGTPYPTYTPYPMPDLLDQHLKYSTVQQVQTFRCEGQVIEPLAVELSLTPVTSQMLEESRRILQVINPAAWEAWESVYGEGDLFIALIYLDIVEPQQALHQPFMLSTQHPTQRFSYTDLQFDFIPAAAEEARFQLVLEEGVIVGESEPFPLPRSLRVGTFYPVILDLDNRTLNNLEGLHPVMHFQLLITLPFSGATCSGEESTQPYEIPLALLSGEAEDILQLGEIESPLSTAELNRLRLALLDSLVQVLSRVSSA